MTRTILRVRIKFDPKTTTAERIKEHLRHYTYGIEDVSEI